MRNRPNLTRLLIFLGIVGTTAAIAAAVMHGTAPATAAAQPPVVAATPAPSALPVAPAVQPLQDCLPGSSGTYIGRHGSVDVLCTLSADGSKWQWVGIAQTSNAYAAAAIGDTVTDTTGATWVCKLATGGSRVWVWLPASNKNWYPPSASYPAEGVTADS